LRAYNFFRPFYGLWAALISLRRLPSDPGSTFVREAGFTEIEREFVSKGLRPEVIIAKRPL
jgi:hypothetical protein